MWLERLRKCTTRGRQRRKNKTGKRKKRERMKIGEIGSRRRLTRILATIVDKDKRDRVRKLGDLGDKKCQGPRRPNRDRPYLERNQCAHCKAKGHWAHKCPKKKQGTKVLSLEDNED